MSALVFLINFSINLFPRACNHFTVKIFKLLQDVLQKQSLRSSYFTHFSHTECHLVR